MNTLFKSPKTNTFTAAHFEDRRSHLAELNVSTEELSLLEKKALNIERAKLTQETPMGGKLCATRHGCQGATDCNYSYANYPG